MSSTFGVVDLFAGPGGLGEGFASVTNRAGARFQIGISVEKEASAHRTLTLRAFLREYGAKHGALPREFIRFHAEGGTEPDWSDIDPGAWLHATEEARCLELGTERATDAVAESIASVTRSSDDTVLIGGPPCQAYSLVGRARSRGMVGYVPEEDHRHYLFREYIRVLDRLRPAIFFMENVKGMLSSMVASRQVFEMLLEDLSSLGHRGQDLYELRAIRIVSGRAVLREPRVPADFVVRAEQFGVPQRRHRVIIVGVRRDFVDKAAAASVAIPGQAETVQTTIGRLPPLRSGLSRGQDGATEWAAVVTRALGLVQDVARATGDTRLVDLARTHVERARTGLPAERCASRLPDHYGPSVSALEQWLVKPELRAIAQHETRGHIAGDLERYCFAALYGAAHGVSPKASDFPDEFTPAHRNWTTGVFADRFRVQLANAAATTITSHISKDGHYFIHPDPLQCRSLTVREVARLQTFPDDYLFLGNRTSQYVQVGNAVPPFLARTLAQLALGCLTGEDAKASGASVRSSLAKPVQLALKS